MRKSFFGRTGLEISEIALGGGVTGGILITASEATRWSALQCAVAGGINWIDTAPFYGWGRAEEVVARAVRGRDDVLIFTKCGTMRRDDGDDYMDLRPETIRADVEGSLRRLGVERLDLLQLHDRDPKVPIEESWGAVLELVAEGKVRHGGISNHRAEEIERALAVGPVAGLQVQYSALERGVEEKILPLALEHGLGVIVWAPLASGFLTDGFSVDELAPDDFRRTHPFAQQDLTELRQTLRDDDGSVFRGALQFVLAHPAVTGAIVGARNEQEGRELAAFAA